MSELEDLRRRIDDIDRRIVDLLVDRLKAAGSIGAAKEAAGLSAYDPERERRVLERAEDVAAGRFPPGPMASIFREIISASRAVEADRSVLVHGTWGSLAHHAAVLRFGASARTEPTPRAENIFAKLEDGSAGYAVVSLEGHSLEASLDRLDLFLHSKAVAFGEIHVRPRLGLFSADPAGAQGPVFGSPAVVMQASRWIERHARDREVRVVGTVEDALREARQTGGAALGYPVLEILAGLSPLEIGIEDLPEASRRFLILSRREAKPTGKDKTSILAVIANRPGALHGVTGVFARQGINVCWLEPKATHLGRWDHLFVLELEGHREDAAVAAALEELRRDVDLLQVLGSYPSETPPDRPF